MPEFEQLTAEVRELKALVLQLLEAKVDSRQKIYPLKEAWRELGYRSYVQCWRRIGKLYRPGIEAIDRRNPGETSPDWWLHLEKCREREQTHAAKRR